jgi:pyridoxal phosphate enzyme (YggS family)
VADLIRGLSAERVRSNLDRVREEIADAAARASRDPADVEICAAIKYVPAEELGALAEAGVTLVGENRAQDLEVKQAAYGPAFQWDFIGHLQSRKVKQVVPRVRVLHSLASESALAQLERHAEAAAPRFECLVEVNVAGEGSKTGIAPEELDAFLERCPVRVGGLMTMPPLAEDPEHSRPHFAALRELAVERGLPRLSMGSSQDYAVAVEEGATIVRIGTILYR